MRDHYMPCGLLMVVSIKCQRNAIVLHVKFTLKFDLSSPLIFVQRLMKYIRANAAPILKYDI